MDQPKKSNNVVALEGLVMVTDLKPEEAITVNGSSNSTVQQPFKPSGRFILAFISILVVTLAAAIDATSLGVALPIIADELHGTALEAFWAGTSFLITSAVFQPVLAGLSHVFGRKSCILFSTILFVIGSILAAAGPNFRYMYMLSLIFCIKS